jgi:[ribosomal protein S18]-alanine N-acetyltransferase
MRLRPFQSADIRTLLEIDQQCFPSGISYSFNELKSFLGHRLNRTWVAEEESGIAGYLIASRQPRRVGHIITIDVLEPWRRRGVGNLLMDAAECWAREVGLQFMVLETAEDNKVAQRFYLARGYLKIEQLENYYGNGAAAWVMAKRLAGRNDGSPRRRTGK